jgi:hypothetical protein
LEFSLARTPLDLLRQLGLTLLFDSDSTSSLVESVLYKLIAPVYKKVSYRTKKSPCLAHFCPARPPDPSFTQSGNSLPDFLPGSSPGFLPEIVPNSLLESLPSTLPKLLPESYPSVLPRFLPEIVPDSLPEALPGTLLESLSESYLSVLPGLYPSPTRTRSWSG